MGAPRSASTAAAAVTALAVLGVACASAGTTYTAPTCPGPSPPVQDATYSDCSACSPTKVTSCTNATPIEACCTWIEKPSTEVARAVGLHHSSSMDPNVDLTCLSAPPARGTPTTVTLTGYVWSFARGADTTGVKVEVFPEVSNVVSSSLIGTYATKATDAADPTGQAAAAWDDACQPGGCQFHQYTIPNVPTETRLVIKTSDADGAGAWANVYEYDVYFANAAATNGQVAYDATAIASPELAYLAAILGQTLDPSQGVLLGEVHDCSDVRLEHAVVETDQTHQGSIVYFDSDESYPLPESAVPIGSGTGTLGLWAAFGFAPGLPTRVTAVGLASGQTTLLGTYAVQAFPGAVSLVTLRGRRPFQL